MAGHVGVDVADGEGGGGAEGDVLHGVKVRQ